MSHINGNIYHIWNTKFALILDVNATFSHLLYTGHPMTFCHKPFSNTDYLWHTLRIDQTNYAFKKICPDCQKTEEYKQLYKEWLYENL